MKKDRNRRRRVQDSSLRRQTGSGKGKTAAVAPTGRSSHRRPVLRFLLVFGLSAGIFYATTFFLPAYRDRLFPSCLRVTARFAGAALAALGQEVTVTGETISSPRLKAIIVRGCDAVEPIALFACAVLAFPATLVKRLPGILVGALTLAILNLVRIVTLFLIGVYAPGFFEVMHVDVCQGLFIALALVMWLFWILWATQRPIPATQRAA